MYHQPFVLAGRPAKIGKIMRARVVAEEADLEDRKPNIARVELAVNDQRTRQKCRDDAEIARVVGHLVQDDPRLWGQGMQFRQERLGLGGQNSMPCGGD
jgi:hypothetical protein